MIHDILEYSYKKEYILFLSMSYMKREIKSNKKERQLKRIQSCCTHSLHSRMCKRKKDKKMFSLPRRFSKDKCMKTKKKGFSMRSSCAPYRVIVKENRRNREKKQKRRRKIKRNDES